MEVTGRRGRRRRKLLDCLKERRGYSHLKEEALDRTVWRAGFGRGFGPAGKKDCWMNGDGSGCLVSRPGCSNHDLNPPPSLSPLIGPSASSWTNLDVLQRRNASCLWILSLQRAFCKITSTLNQQMHLYNFHLQHFKTLKTTPTYSDLFRSSSGSFVVPC